MEDSLWGTLFDTPTAEEEVELAKKLANKIKKPKELKGTRKVSSSLSFADKLLVIRNEVYKILGKHKGETMLITDKEGLSKYIDKAIENGIISIDTETNNSLDPITCKLMGPCIYTYGLKQAYIPVNHVDYNTKQRLPNQLTEQDVALQFLRLKIAGTRIVYHNAQFDMRVIQCTCNVELPVYWDTLIASQILNENEGAGLKEQYTLHVDPNHGKYDIESLFEGEQYAYIPPDLFALYAATDAMMTLRLYDYQLKEFLKPENVRIYDLYLNIEIPCIPVVKDMELEGIEVDLAYAERLSKKYHNILDKYDIPLQEELLKLKPKIDAWRQSDEANYRPREYATEEEMNILKAKSIDVKKKEKLLAKYPEEDKKGRFKYGKSKNEQLCEPINIESSTQLAIILYDILKVPSYNKKKPRSTDKNTLPIIAEELGIKLVEVILERKAFKTLVNNFIDKIPSLINERTGRIHCNFNQVGTVTGRFSCSDPNLQQIPSKNHEVRLMFKARDGYVLVGSDFSQQEPRLLANYAQDEYMIGAYKNNKDLYATIASRVYHNNYEDNLEFNPTTGIRSEEGATRRASCKSLLLGIMYGMGTPAIANKLGCSLEEAQSIIDGFYGGFPKVRKWTDETIAKAKQTGYVEDWYGRERRLPNIILPEYEIVSEEAGKDEFNPFLWCEDKALDERDVEKYLKEIEKVKNKPYKKAEDLKKAIGEVKDRAKKEGIRIISNEYDIARNVRQCVNARIQGGAASMTKVAMIKIHRDQELNDLGFKLLIGVHDELIGECPKENAEKVADRLTYIMKTCIEDYCDVPFKCDADISERWYYNVYQSSLEKEMKDMMKTMSHEEAFEELVKEHTESTREILLQLVQ